MNLHGLIRDAASATPDPERSIRNLERLSRGFPGFIEEHLQSIGIIAGLFAYSQFLSDYCIGNPSHLSDALNELTLPVRKEHILFRADEMHALFRDNDHAPVYKPQSMKLLRDLKKFYLLVITMRDISGMTDLQECMSELSALSEAIIGYALEMSFTLMRRKYGLLRQNAFSVIGMGKLGGGELNYSSDIDIITVYLQEEGTSTGTLNLFGIRHNVISSHEYHCMLTETLSGMIHSATEDGIAYRVDLRLRPNGRQGAASLSLASYRAYYEAWGKTWERLALIRAKPVAGDACLGESFMRTIEPFVWKRSTDYNDIDEIRDLKKKIDTIFDANDIKRGYGGIREIEFFAQTFQLLYGGEKENLRTGFLVGVLRELRKEGFLSSEDLHLLSEGYLILRRIEHLLQMKDDLQTYTIPSDPDELRILARKLHYANEQDFLAKLKLTRLKVRDMYNTLLGGTDTTREILLSVIDELPDESILDYLRFKGFRNPLSALKNMRSLREQISTCKTQRERTLLRKAIPAFLELTMSSVRRDTALGNLVSFIDRIGHHESFTDLLLQRNDTRKLIADIFSTSTYLSRMLLSTDNLEGIFEYPHVRMDLRSMREGFTLMLARAADPLTVIREFKNIEELKYGMLFLGGFINVYSFTHRLSMLADTIIRAITSYLGAEKKYAVVGIGGYGARDLNIGSDLDLLFIGSSGDRIRRSHDLSSPANTAEEMIRFLSGYTAKGFAYRIDMRLRPDGSRGILSHDIEGYRAYYLSAAQPWEIQSLLRARPVAGEMRLLRSFMRIRKQVILQRGQEIQGSQMHAMRRRIVEEVSKESSGCDMKNGPGGIKEIEFLIQYLQMKHAAGRPDLIVHDTTNAFQRLGKYAILDRKSGEFLLQSHGFLKAVDTLLRFNEEDVVKADSELLCVMSGFLQITSTDLLLKRIDETRQKVYSIAQTFYEHTKGKKWQF
jgi:[glutamine synthetase] adenylyltransferase / [glutamine synthetase]-adenylyl-L-tyrosine phosphorylase